MLLPIGIAAGKELEAATAVAVAALGGVGIRMVGRGEARGSIRGDR